MTGPSGDQPYQPYPDKPGQPSYGEQPYGGQQSPYGQQPSYEQQPYGQQPSYPPPPPPPYEQGAYPGPVGHKPLSTLSLLALITGIFCGLVGVILGVLGLRDTKGGQKRGRGLAIAGIVLGVLGTVVATAIVLLSAVFVDKLAGNLEVGECLAELPTEDTVITLDKVDCSEPHVGEAYATVTVEDSPTYPGVDVLMSYQEECVAELPSGAGDVGFYLLYPIEESWDAGDRTIVCIATTDEPTTGSIG